MRHRAASASNLRLGIDVGAGLVSAGAATFLRLPGWVMIASAAVCFASFGAWGLSDRLLAQAPEMGRQHLVPVALILRAFSVATGLLAALMLLFGAAGSAMGTWIS